MLLEGLSRVLVHKRPPLPLRVGEPLSLVWGTHHVGGYVPVHTSLEQRGESALGAQLLLLGYSHLMEVDLLQLLLLVLLKLRLGIVQEMLIVVAF